MKLLHNHSVMPDLIRHPGFSGSSFDFAPFDSAQGRQDKQDGEPVEPRLEVYPALDAGLRSGRDDGLRSFILDQAGRLAASGGAYVKLHRSLVIGTGRSLWLGLRSLSYDPHKLLPSTGSGQARRQARKAGGFL